MKIEKLLVLLLLLLPMLSAAQTSFTSLTVTGDDGLGPVGLDYTHTILQGSFEPFSAVGEESYTVQQPYSFSSISINYQVGQDILGRVDVLNTSVQIQFQPLTGPSVQVVTPLIQGSATFNAVVEMKYTLTPGTVVTVATQSLVVDPIGSCFDFCGFEVRFTLNP